MHHWISVVCWPKFTKFFSPNMEGVVVERVFLRFSICWSFPGILAIKSRKLSNIVPKFGRFGPPRILGAGLPKVVPTLSPLPRGTSSGKSFARILPLAPKLYIAHTLNFRPNFKFSPLNFLGPPSPMWGALGSVGQSLTCVKIWRGSTP